MSDPDMLAHIWGDHSPHRAEGEPRADAPYGWLVRCSCGWSKRRRYRSAAAAELTKHLEAS